MKKILVCLMLLSGLCAATIALAVRDEGVRGRVGAVSNKEVSIEGKTYSVYSRIRVVIKTKEGISYYEKTGQLSDLRVGDYVYAVVNYDMVKDITIERWRQ